MHTRFRRRRCARVELHLLCLPVGICFNCRLECSTPDKMANEIFCFEFEHRLLAIPRDFDRR